jgi:hypothetical protein
MDAAQKSSRVQDTPICLECTHLYDEFVDAIAETIALQAELPYAIYSRGTAIARFALLQQTAAHRRQEAKQSLMLHIQRHNYGHE